MESFLDFSRAFVKPIENTSKSNYVSDRDRTNKNVSNKSKYRIDESQARRHKKSNIIKDNILEDITRDKDSRGRPNYTDHADNTRHTDRTKQSQYSQYNRDRHVKYNRYATYHRS